MSCIYSKEYIMNDVTYDDGYPFDINYDEVLKVARMSATKDVVRLVKSRQYISPGDYTSLLTTAQLEELVEAINDEMSDDFSEVMLISEILARAEGLDPSDSAEISLYRIKSIMGFISIESLDRKGYAVAHRMNFTFDPAYGHLNIAEKKPGAGDLS